MADQTYRGFRITYDPPPIPLRTMDWHFVHEEYDGAEDAHDNRAGDASSYDGCLREIDALLDD